MSISENIKKYKTELPEDVTLVAISKTKPTEDLLEAYEAGQRNFGENKIQEMTDKWEELPKDIKWHMVGHVQRNKVKYMAPYVSLIHAVDSLKLLKEINKEADKNDRSIDCLLQIKIAEEDSKYGISAEEAKEILDSEKFKSLDRVKVKGLMGMATFTDDETQVKKEFEHLKSVFNDFKETYSNMNILSMGMSGDYKIALDCGSNMVRIGSDIFGERNY
ncbi:YggS family pyridoxal phosphate-dependent enzyme [Salegentibacter sp. T436]|jgi:pyridoxal phosphate enzyme (YggS family)|uniref:YggS family pyridoxal phosphate-dependent enzyme n=1 Tax=Salegentibacter sp. T436 TaxID=1729720 RepID=UPI00094A7198|nr:YggS family pyridoxal phosphate-dependent enzyme [Salegentibacter sp. T436]APS40129.1 alanine racemase [Salegentibacter sp. T436]|tara:strand:+ start:151 stop:807 length:657 start_codon:yes stop_codon:yes gene_type:complete